MHKLKKLTQKKKPASHIDSPIFEKENVGTIRYQNIDRLFNGISRITLHLNIDENITPPEVNKSFEYFVGWKL